MKIKKFTLDRDTIENFAVTHDLTMQVHERSRNSGPNKFYAYFESAETKDGCILCGDFGNGHDEQEAIQNYAKEISGKLLVIDAYSEERRREIRVPILEG